jgi:hypothetical protein
LRINATAIDSDTRSTPAATTQSGVYAFHNLPGIHDLEYDDGSTTAASPPASPPAGKDFAILVEDPERRFLPWGVVLRLPRRDLFQAFVFSAPSRPMAPGLAVIRGSLKDATRTGSDGQLFPAAHTLVEARYEETSPPTVYVGLADGRGQFALFLPFPNPLRPPAGTAVTSPNTPGRRMLSELRWPVTLSFAYQPDRQRFICTRPDGRVEIVDGQQPGLTDEPPPGWRCVPDLPSLLRDQSAAEIARPAISPPAINMEIEIEYGKDKVVRAVDGDPADASVWISPQTVSSP